MTSMGAAGGTQKPPVVSTAAGSVTLTELAVLRGELERRQQESRQKLDEASSLDALHDERLVEIGAALIDHAAEWTPDNATKALIARASDLKARVASDESQVEALKSEDHHGLGGVVNRVRGWNDTRRATADKSSAESQLRLVLKEIAKAAPVATVQSVATLRDQAGSAEQQCAELRAAADAASAAAGQIADEIKRRDEAINEMGFDSLYTAAYLQTYGPQSVQSPLNLKRGEIAVAVTDAKLARNQTRTRYVGGSQSFSFPIGHTGIRYRVGSYQGHPVQQQVLATLDVGTFVVTNQRIAFIGRTKSISAALPKLVHIQCYSDALAVFQQGRENADYYLMAQPKYLLFMINWVSAQATG